jgi:hypothetical protein
MPSTLEIKTIHLFEKASPSINAKMDQNTLASFTILHRMQIAQGGTRRKETTLEK